MYNPYQPDMQAQLNNFNNIPEELKVLPQWLVWKFEDIGAAKPTKVPYNPISGEKASTTNPNTWVKFEEAVEAFKTCKWDGIGFVFSDKDPYTFIDLDDTHGDAIALDKQIKIFREFDSYSEKSPSGTGLHIIIKGEIPVGRRRNFIEMYSSGRYATFTGDIYHKKGIEYRQELLTQLFEQIGSSVPQTNLFVGDAQEKETDEVIIERAANADNGIKFSDLFSGSWNTYYPSQSEADLALINIIAFYTQNRNQIKRIFHKSDLGKRLKAQRQDYLNWMIDKSFDKMLPDLDFDGFTNVLKDHIQEIKNEGAVAQRLEPSAHNGLVVGSSPTSTTTKEASVKGKPAPFEGVNPGSNPGASTNSKPHLNLPPGLLGEIALFIYQSSPRPVPEIALAAAIGLMSGITGRAYNVSGTGLNQYVLLLAGTGSGKEGMALGIDKLMHEIRQQVPTAMNFIGPSEIASGQALIKYIANNSQCFVTILGEFGLRLLQMANYNANGAEVSLRRMLLDLYNKSGFGQIARPSVYADKDKNTSAIPSPSFSILGESTPERFYGALNEDMISEGLLPRFLLIEYNGYRVPFNKIHGEIKPTFSLIEKLTTVCANAEMIQNSNPRKVINVKFTREAEQISDSYDRYADSQINLNGQKDVVKQLWNRAHIKVLKLAAIIAVGINMFEPLIEADHMNWAISMVNNDIETLSLKFEEGKIGMNTSEIKQIDDIIRIIKEYVMQDWEYVKKYSDKSEKSEKMYNDKVISYSYISRRLVAQSAFKNDKLGATAAIKRCLQIMIDRDYIREMSKGELGNRFGTSQRAFIVTNPTILK